MSKSQASSQPKAPAIQIERQSSAGQSSNSLSKPTPNMKSAKVFVAKAVMCLETNFGRKLDRGSPLDIFQEVLEKLQNVDRVLKQLTTVGDRNPVPHLLDAQPSFIPAVNKLKDAIEGIQKYIDDYLKRNMVGKKVQASSITKKIRLYIDTMD